MDSMLHHKKSDIWISHLKTLREKIGSDLVRDLGKAKDVKLLAKSSYAPSTRRRAFK